MRWAKQVFPQISGLAYFLNKEPTGQFLKVLFIAHVKFKVIKKDLKASKNYIEYDSKSSLSFINKVFDNLNDFQDKHNISEETNKKLSFQIMNFFSGGQHEKGMKK